MSGLKVSVVIPAYNQAIYLGEAIQSVLDQTVSDWELIVVNDGSTDETEKMVSHFQDPRIRYIYQENRGLAGARNTGLRSASGAYVTFLDADDLFVEEKIAWEVEELENHPDLGFVAGQTCLIDSDGNELGLMCRSTLPEDLSLLLLGNPIAVGSCMGRREWFERAGYFDESLRACEDWDLWIRLALDGCKMKGLEKPVFCYRVHSAQMTRDVERMRTAMFAVLNKVFNRTDLPDHWRGMRNEAYAAAHVRSAARAYHADQVELALQDLSAAVRLNPGLTAGGGHQLSDVLAGWADAPSVKDPLAYLEKVYANLPAGLEVLDQNRHRILADMALHLAYRQYHRNNLHLARRYILRAAGYRPEILMNRGILSMLVRSLSLVHFSRHLDGQA